VSQKIVWKFVLDLQAELEMPVGAQILSVREQGQDVCLWALVDPDAPKMKRGFLMFGTGYPIPDMPLQFLGTAHLHGGALVCHVFEIVEGDAGSALVH